MKWYVGLTGAHVLKAFRATAEPTAKTHGKLYLACVGPFKTRRGALWAESHALNNPHALTVAQCERIAKAAQ